MRNFIKKGVVLVQENARSLGGVMLVAASGSAMADSTMDTSTVVATIATAVAACGLIGAAWMGFKYLQKAWNKL